MCVFEEGRSFIIICNVKVFFNVANSYILVFLLLLMYDLV